MDSDKNLINKEAGTKKEEFKLCDNCKTTKRKLYQVKAIEDGHIENLCYDCRFNRHFGRTLQEILDDNDGFTVAQELFQLVRYGNYLAPYSQFANYIYFAYITGQIKNGGILKALLEDKRNLSQFSEKKNEIIDNLKRAHIINREDEDNYYFTQPFLDLMDKYKGNSTELFSRILGLCLVNIIAFSKYDSDMKQIWLSALLKNLIDKSKAMAYEDRLVEDIKEYECSECNKRFGSQDAVIAHLKENIEKGGHKINLPKDDQYLKFFEPVTIAIGYKLYLKELEATIQKRMSPNAFMKFFTDGINAHFYFYSEEKKDVLKEDKNGEKYFIVKAPWIRVVCKTLEKVKELELVKETQM